ncbi:hypothetical protein EAH79_10270 [Sphingomonas koreensis]|nr:hypothetical protein EAH79_10270 [Sphingomonas koreensis]
MKRALLIGGLAATLAGCVSGPTARPTLVPGPAPAPFTGLGLERVMGQTAPALIGLFGQPDADVREGDARKLQFQGPICVLDTYLYPKSGGDPVVSYLDARQSDGRTIDRASCVAALIRREGGK